ncbi:MAG TPA: dienelactone hydrolase family protein [Ktedonobacterales bacterium]|nr:dienelactone hydrolase family protein [Ktedonobacterales bacterium]
MSAADERVVAQDITFPFGSGTRPAYLALPTGEGPFPGVVVIHEISGLTPNIQDIARRFAAEGYAALAADLFSGRNRAMCMFRLIGQLRIRTLDNAALDELKAALSYLAARSEVDAAHLGAVGYCMGGSFAVAWACTDDRLQAIAPYYAMNPRTLEAVRRACPVVGSYPGDDFTAGAGRKLDTALATYGVAHDIKVYPGAKHSFFNDQRSHYNAAAAADSWQRVLAFFKEHLG